MTTLLTVLYGLQSGMLAAIGIRNRQENPVLASILCILALSTLIVEALA